jgi:hypothetical protein
MDVFLFFFGFPFRVMFVVRHLFPEIRAEVPGNFLRGLNFYARTIRVRHGASTSRELRRVKTAWQAADDMNFAH